MNTLMNGLKRSGLGPLLLLSILLVVVLPLSLDIFRLNLVGKYLTYAFVAVGLVMVWGYGGVLSLGQGVFFGLGGYAMAMFLKLEASDPITTRIQSTPGIPDFMDWNQITELPTFWLPFKSLPLTLILVIAVPMLLAWIISYAMFKRRVGGVYFSIITQAVTFAAMAFVNSSVNMNSVRLTASTTILCDARRSWISPTSSVFASLRRAIRSSALNRAVTAFRASCTAGSMNSMSRCVPVTSENPTTRQSASATRRRSRHSVKRATKLPGVRRASSSASRIGPNAAR
jgi:hypothetical protein